MDAVDAQYALGAVATLRWEDESSCLRLRAGPALCIYSDQVLVGLQVIQMRRSTRHCHGWSERSGRRSIDSAIGPENEDTQSCWME